MQSITYQLFLRPALPEVNGCKEYREERQLFIRIDELLHTSGLENDFIDLCLQHRGEDLKKTSAKRLAYLARHSVLALRSNIARHYKNLDHRDFCIRLADSPLLQWFLKIGRVEGIKAFAKSSSDRFAHIIGEDGLRAINARLIAPPAPSTSASKPTSISMTSTSTAPASKPHPLPRRLGPPARRHPHPHESHRPHSPGRTAPPHAPGTPGLPKRHQHPLHENDRQIPNQRRAKTS
ncbi:hypothetical protein V2O64_03155 [Verrucomicrobiaceae bacterium 227]